MRPVKRAKVYRPNEEKSEEYTEVLVLPADKKSRRAMMKARAL
jgi:hypothetical protein